MVREERKKERKKEQRKTLVRVVPHGRMIYLYRFGIFQLKVEPW